MVSEVTVVSVLGVVGVLSDVIVVGVRQQSVK